MTKDFEKLLYLFGAAARGKEYDISKIEDVDNIVNLALKQGVWSVIHPQLATVSEGAKYHLDFLQFVSKAVARNEFTLNILREAESRGIKCCILKGVFAASMYANPDCRVSGDTDILIKPDDLEKLVDLLLENGYDMENAKENEYHLGAKHPVGGLLEIHVKLHDKLYSSAMFSGADSYSEAWLDFDVSGKTYHTLGINDNFVFLTMHYIRHFISGGSSIRHIMDLVLYMDKYKDNINWEAYNKLLANLKYDKLIRLTKSIAAKYFGMDFERCQDEDMNLILDDMESCGIFGREQGTLIGVDDDISKNSKTISGFNRAYIYVSRYVKNLFTRIFTPQKTLLKLGYTYAKYFPLIPFAWVHKAAVQAICHFTHREMYRMSEEELNRLDQRREIMKKLSIID